MSEQMKINYMPDIKSLEENINKKIRRASITVITAILILGGMLIVATTTVSLYNTYSTNKQIESCLQIAYEQNRQVDIVTQSGYQAILNPEKKDSLAITGRNSNIVSIRIYPRNTYQQKIVTPRGQVITPY